MRVVDCWLLLLLGVSPGFFQVVGSPALETVEYLCIRVVCGYHLKCAWDILLVLIECFCSILVDVELILQFPPDGVAVWGA